MLSPAQIAAMAERFDVTPQDVRRALALVRSGRVDLVVAVLAEEMTVREALAAARAGKGARGCSP